MEKVNELREVLNKKLEELEKVEGEKRSEGTIEETKALLALSDEELIKKVEENYKEKCDDKEISDEELDNVAGGSLFTVMGEILYDHMAGNYYRKSKVKYSCPNCGSWDVDNIDIGAFYKMRVICHKCGFRGCRDGAEW